MANQNAIESYLQKTAKKPDTFISFFSYSIVIKTVNMEIDFDEIARICHKRKRKRKCKLTAEEQSTWKNWEKFLSEVPMEEKKELIFLVSNKLPWKQFLRKLGDRKQKKMLR